MSPNGVVARVGAPPERHAARLIPLPRPALGTAAVIGAGVHSHARPRQPIQVRCVLSAAGAGLAGALALVPPAFALSGTGHDVVWYGRAVVGRLTERADITAYLGVHALIGIATAFPLAMFWRSFGRPHDVPRRAGAGALYGLLNWLVLYTAVLPALYRTPPPWTAGIGAVLPGLGELVLYGVVVAVVLGWIARCPLEAQGRPCGHGGGIDCLFLTHRPSQPARHRINRF